MDPKAKATNLTGDPYFSGLDYIWGLEKRGKKWSKGKIMDPENAKTYSCDIWIEKDNLIVRGKIGPFGRNQTWIPVKNSSELPEGLIVPNNITPVIPSLK